jgi:DNA-binding SARP family transcriptional activator/TolB-like protein
MIRLQLLGAIDLRDANGRELRDILAQPKRLALLAYLAAASPTGSQRRDTLLGLFWPELDQEHARNSLSKAIHFLRRSLGEGVIVSRSAEELALDDNAAWVDVRAFSKALESDQTGHALELYRGDLLPSFFVPDSPGFEEWLERERARLRAQAAAAARALAERLEAGRHHTLALACARRAVELSNGDERPVRKLIELLDRLGDRAGALRAYEEFARRLAAELEVVPAPETRALIERIRSVPPSPPLIASERPAPSIGRDPPIERLANAVGHRYKIERQLGAGAMAVVALAHDLRHHRRVAIKILRPELSALMGPERFLREIDIAASLMHPHILPLHDSGEANGLLYYVMPYVEGESLRGRLERERRLPLTDALQVGGEVADALAYAHHRGFVHRDIKPENILLGGGHALVADFGIARAIGSAGGEQLTTKGVGTGTPAYMSPEQVTGESPVDERTDIYALGCVLYEMISGEPPFRGSTPEETLAQRLSAPVRPLSALRKEVDPELDSIIRRALARAPSDRFATAAEFGKLLTARAPRHTEAEAPRSPRRKVAWAIPITGAAAAMAIWVAGGTGVLNRTPLRNPAFSSVAVLPIENLSGDTTKAYLAEGLTADLIDKLFRVKGLRVPGAATVARYRGRRPDPKQVARDLGVQAVITGDVREIGGRPRVALQLVSSADGFVRWSGTYDQSNPAVDPDIAGVLAESLRIQLRPESRVLARRRGTRDPEAYRLYLQGRHLMGRVGRTSVRQGLQALEQAIARDSGYADAWASLPMAYGLLFQLGGLTETEHQVLTRRAVERAIELDSLSGEAYAARAHHRIMYEWNYIGADRDYRRAIELTPGSALNLMLYSQYLDLVALNDSAVTVMRQALRLEPIAAWYIANYAFRLASAGRLDQALAEARRALKHDSTQWVAYHALAWVYWRRGDYANAAREARHGLLVFGDTIPFLLGRIGQYAALAGQRTEAKAVLAKLETSQRPDAMWIGLVRLGLGDHSGALEALERAADNRDGWLSMWLASGEFEALRGAPRYETLLKRVGVAEFRNRRFRRNPPS